MAMFPRSFMLLVRTLHIYLSMLALLLLLFFAATGFLMNHSEWFKTDDKSAPDVKLTIPDKIMHPTPDAPIDEAGLVAYLRQQCGARGDVDASGLGDDPARIVIAGPRHRYEAEISRADGQTTVRKTSRSFLDYLGNLHKGEHAGAPWKRIIDGVSILLALVSITGLLLWMTLGKRRMLGLISLGACAVICAVVYLLWVP